MKKENDLWTFCCSCLYSFSFLFNSSDGISVLSVLSPYYEISKKLISKLNLLQLFTETLKKLWRILQQHHQWHFEIAGFRAIGNEITYLIRVFLGWNYCGKRVTRKRLCLWNSTAKTVILEFLSIERTCYIITCELVTYVYSFYAIFTALKIVPCLLRRYYGFRCFFG